MVDKQSVRIVCIAAIVLTGSRGAWASSLGDIWASDPLTKVMRNARPGNEASRSLLLSGARGEVVSAQVAVRPQKNLGAVSASITPLQQRDGDDPYSEEGISKGLPPGDRAIAYPGKTGLLGSLRFSDQRDGIEDLEYLWVLEERLRELKDRVASDASWLDPRQRPLELCRRVIWSFHDYTRDPNILFETRQAIAEEIERMNTGPLLVVQTSPPEGTFVPAGPRHIGIRGLVPPGASVVVNDKPVGNIRASGYFRHVHFLADDQATITISVEHEGRTRTTQRTFKLGD